MKRKSDILPFIYMLFIATLLGACSEKISTTDEDSGKSARLTISFHPESTKESRATDATKMFSSLALYIFNKDDGYCEYSELITTFAEGSSVEEYSRSVLVTPTTKVIYAIGNYNSVENELSLTLSPNTTMEQLEEMMVQNTTFTDNGLLMIGKEEVAINQANVNADVIMERLVARMDIYLFKNEKLKDIEVNVVSVELVNLIQNSQCKYQVQDMPATPVIGRDNRNIGKALSGYTGGNLPETPDLIYYSYQNTATTGTPNDNITPYIRVTVQIDGDEYTYRGYITDEGQTANKYNLMRNTRYRIIAMLDQPDNQLILQVSVLPWNVSESQTGGDVTDDDFTFGSDGDDETSNTGIIHNPYELNGEQVIGSNYANYSFVLNAPKGAIWIATLTNGLEFEFVSNPWPDGTKSVSTGIARDAEYHISIGAKKSWAGVVRSTYFYITVNGQKLNINPVQSNGTRKYPGTTDTDILIKQESN